MAQHNTLGQKGEEKAKNYLQEQGYMILHTNWRYKHKEIDLVAKKDGLLVFVEVKTRTAGGMQVAEDSITHSKMRFLIDAAEAYVQKYDRMEEVQFDVLALTFEQGNWEITHIKEAFNAMDI